MKGWVSRKYPELDAMEKEYIFWLRLPNGSEEQLNFQSGFGDGANRYGKIYVIKWVRFLTGCGLKESKDLIELWEDVSNGMQPRIESAYSDGRYRFATNATSSSQLLRDFGYSVEGAGNSRRMLRPVDEGITGEKVACKFDHHSTFEWRIVGEYKIHVARFCPDCGKALEPDIKVDGIY